MTYLSPRYERQIGLEAESVEKGLFIYQIKLVFKSKFYDMGRLAKSFL